MCSSSPSKKPCSTNHAHALATTLDSLALHSKHARGVTGSQNARNNNTPMSICRISLHASPPSSGVLLYSRCAIAESLWPMVTWAFTLAPAITSIRTICKHHTHTPVFEYCPWIFLQTIVIPTASTCMKLKRSKISCWCIHVGVSKLPRKCRPCC